MKPYKYLFLILLCISFAGQAQEIKPIWLKKTPVAGNPSYQFQVFQVPMTNQLMAKKQLPDVASYYLERNYNVRGVTIETFELSESYSDNKKISRQTENIRDTVYTESGAVDVTLRLIDEYQDVDKVWFLCAIPSYRTSVVNYDKMTVTSKYGIRYIWPSFIVPGAGQMVKGDWLKGGLFMGGTVALAGGALFTHLQSNIYNRKVYEAGGKEEAMRIYANRARNFGTGRNVCLGGLAALYIYNIIDAFVAPGARRVEVIPNGVAVNF